MSSTGVYIENQKAGLKTRLKPNFFVIALVLVV